jgi:hypothetical protein
MVREMPLGLVIPSLSPSPEHYGSMTALASTIGDDTHRVILLA